MESFAARVKRELQSVTRMPTHCRRAQKAGYEIFSGERSEWFDPKKDCCIRAFIRGAFVAAGTVSDPAGSYHFEITCPDEESAVGMLSLTLLSTRRQIRRLFKASVKSALKGGDAA